MMNPERWQQVRNIFDGALEHTPDERPRFLDKVCANDQEVRREVESLLSSLDSAEHFMETPAVAKVADVIEAETKKLETGKCFGHYEIIEQIGAGGMGEVYLAKDTRINTANRDELYEIGIADSLILKLGSMNGFVVRPLSATRQYTNIGQDALIAGREQQVDYVLASNYQLAGGKIRITSQLLNVASGQIEETYKSEKDAGDVFAMQDAIAGEVGNILSARFGSTSSGATAKRGTTNEEAYRLYLQGIYILGKNRDRTNAGQAVEILEQAVRLDPNYAQAWAGKAHAHRLMVNATPSGNIYDYQKSLEAINKALALDENLADAHSALCENKMYYEYDFDAAERSCKRAIELDPNNSRAHEIYSRYLVTRGRIDEGIAEIKTAIDIEPTLRFNQRWYGDCLMLCPTLCGIRRAIKKSDSDG
ncbi:MAG: hypothetical protein WKF71_16410 [Pyrinomonadaceae bacterium]